MRNTNIAIVGLEHQGELLLEWLIGCGDEGPNIVCAVAMKSGAGRHRADARGIALVDFDRLIRLSDGIDIVFDLSGDSELRVRVHQALAACGNHHTQILSARALRMIGLLQTEQTRRRAA